jgi:drug/metabolite transporter (DMT)-like permease
LDRPSSAPPACGCDPMRDLAPAPTAEVAIEPASHPDAPAAAADRSPAKQPFRRRQAATRWLFSYFWPVEIVAAGAVILTAGGKVPLSATGVGLALFSGLSWAAYCVFRVKWPLQPARNVLGTGCAISTALCAVLHFALEPTAVPSLGALGAAAAVGVVPLALGNFVWDQGFQRGDSQLLAVRAYATPLCSAVLLGAIGPASLTWGLLVGAVVIVTAGVLSRAHP